MTTRLAAVVVLALLSAPCVGLAQPPKEVRIGYLSGNPSSDTKEALEAFRSKLGALGYVEGRNLVLDARYAEGRYDRLPEMSVIANPQFAATPPMLAEMKPGAQSLGVELLVVEARNAAELPRAFATMTEAKAQGMLVLADPMFIAERRRIDELALSPRLPAIYHLRHFVEAGGLMSYGAEYPEMFQQSAVLLGKILKGAKPADLPVEQPWGYLLAINLKTAKALGLTVPQSLLGRAGHIVR